VAWLFYGAEAWQASEWLSSGPAGGSPVGWQDRDLVGWQAAARQFCGVEGGSMGTRLFFQCIVVWRSLPRTRCSGAEISALPGALPQPSMSPAPQQGP
jgi:hypothetical protein